MAPATALASAAGELCVDYLLVFIGAGLGGMARYVVGRAALTIGGDFPWGTMAINIAGSLAMGLVAGWFLNRGGADQNLRLFLTTGVIGGFTTFSTFSLEAALLWERGQLLAAGLYVGGSVLIGVAGVFVGLAAIR